MKYDEYLDSDAWRRVRRDALEWACHRCQICNRPGPILHVHHRTYERLGEEDLADLTVLCERCHDYFHRIIEPKDMAA